MKNWVIDKAVLDMFLTTKPFDPKPKAEHAIIESLTWAVSPQSHWDIQWIIIAQILTTS